MTLKDALNNSGATTKFPPFRERARLIPISQYQTLMRTKSNASFCTAEPETTEYYDLSARVYMYKLLFEFVELLNHYHIQYWIDGNIESHFYCRVGMDLEMIWVLQWISEVYKHVRFRLEVSPLFALQTPDLTSKSCAQGRFYDSQSNASVFVVGYSQMQNTAIPAGLDRPTLESFDPWALEKSPMICKTDGNCIWSGAIFPVFCREWMYVASAMPRRLHQGGREACLLPAAQKFVNRLSSQHSWRRINESTRLLPAIDDRKSLPSFTETSRFIPSPLAASLLGEVKFFQEVYGSMHYDGRYYRGKVLNQRAEMKNTFRAFAALMDAYAVPYFLDYGSLVGWHWRRDSLPWDDDIDVGVRWFHLFVLQWISEVYRHPTYRLEINPHFMLGSARKTENNIIDGRFLNTENGIFIDIIGYREENEDENTAGLFLDEIDDYYQTSKQVCRDNKGRTFPSEVLFPVQRTTFMSGIQTWVPHNPTEKLHLAYGPTSTTMYGPRKLLDGKWVLKSTFCAYGRWC